MLNSNHIAELSDQEVAMVSGGCKDHENAGKELADAIQDGTHKVFEWVRNLSDSW